MARLIMLGRCPNCGAEIVSRYPFEIGICHCRGNPVEVPLRLAIIPAERHIKTLEKIAEFRSVSIKKLIAELLDVWL